MLVYEEETLSGFEDPIWLYPAPPPAVSEQVPRPIRREIEEARSCLRHGLYTAAAVMAGRAVEGIAQSYGIEGKALYASLRELEERKILDGRFVVWVDHLRIARNQAAHFTGSQVTAADAGDMIALVEAIAMHLFVVSKRFDEFMQRQGRHKRNSTRQKAIVEKKESE